MSTYEITQPELQIKAREIYKKFLKGNDPQDLAADWNLSLATICKYIKWAAEEIDSRFDHKVYKQQLDASVSENLEKLDELYGEAEKIGDKVKILAEVRKTKELKGKIRSILGADGGGGGNQPINIFLPNLHRGEGTKSVVIKEGDEKKGEIKYESE